MAKLPDKDTLAKEAAREALNFEINGRTFREWLEILARYVTEQEEEPKEANLFFYDAKKDAFVPLKYSREGTEHIEEKTREEKPERLTIREWRNLDPWETCGDLMFNCTRACTRAGCKGCIVPKLYAKLAKFEDEQEKGGSI